MMLQIDFKSKTDLHLTFFTVPLPFCSLRSAVRLGASCDRLTKKIIQRVRLSVSSNQKEDEK
jgi:hypothetical protein